MMRFRHRLLLQLLIKEVLAAKNTDFEISSRSRLADEIKNDVFDIITKSYDKLGGNAKIKEPDDISREYDDWIVADTDDDPDVDVFVGGNKKGPGMKLGVSATDGSAAAKTHMMQLKKRLFNNGWWAETSGAAAHVAINKLHVPTVTDEKLAKKLLGDKEITWHGAHPDGEFPHTYGWYTRNIGGKEHTKIIVGNI